MSPVTSAGEAESAAEEEALDTRRLAVGGSGNWSLLGTRCPSCGTIAHPVRPRCLACGATATTVELRKHGTVLASTTVRVTRPDVLLKPPFQIVLARLDDGPVVTMPACDGRAFEYGEDIDVAALELQLEGRAVVAFQATHRFDSSGCQ